MNDIFESAVTSKIWDDYIDPGVVSRPSTQEIRDKNFDKLYSILLSDGYKYTTKNVHCTDGDEYEITEIRGPKASGFFIFFLFFFVVCVQRGEILHLDSPAVDEKRNHPRHVTALNKTLRRIELKL